uniref:Egal-1 winged helix domain-containing protein n=1 Tax=Rhipicephalus appendiculatus TaxID=34631 RepID=A0A131YPN5_RHIAP
MSNNEKQCLVYFTHVIQGEKQSELSPVSIADLSSYLSSAQVNIRRHIKSIYNGDLVEFFKRFPEIFQLEGTTHVYLTSDIMKKYGVDELEKMAVDFLKNKLKAMNAYHFSPVPLMALRKCLGEAPLGVQALMAKNYPAKDMRRLLQAYPDIFGVSNSGNVYLLGEAPRPLNDCSFQNYWPSDTSCLDAEISQDEADAVHFFRQVLNSPGIKLASCSVDSLFAQVCEAPDNVQHFIKSNYTEVNFLDFFRAHKSAFSVTTDGSPPETLDGNDDEESDEEEFPPLPTQDSDYLEKSSDDAWEPSHDDSPLNPEAAAIKYFEDVIKTRMQDNELTHVDQLRQRLADAPLIVFSYFSDEYPYGKFDKFFLDHPDHFSIESKGVVELASTAKGRASNAESYEQVQHSSSSSTSEGRVSGCEDSSGALHARNVQVEKLLEKYFADLFHLAYSYGVRVVKPETALEISSCLNRRLTGYLSDNYGKNVVEFFQHYQSRFRVSKNGNICLAVEKDLSTDTTAKKQPNVLAVEFYVALMQLLEAHQVKAISPEVLWNFLPLTPPKVQGYLCKVYTKDNFKSFFLKAPTKFAMSKNKNVYLSSGSGCSKRDSSDVDEYDFESASENTHEASALEHFVDLIKSLRVNTYPVPISMLQEHLLKASSFVKDYFEDVYPQEKFVNFFLKYDDFFYVLQPINVVWLTKVDGGEVEVDGEVCPLDTMPSSFRLVVGVVAAALLVKSPKPFSTILGHLNIVKDQYSQELNKQPGKSKTEKLCSLVSNCFDMFKIVKDNTILSWPLKYASSLLSALEDALAEVCVKLAAEDIVEVSNFHLTLRRNTERLFQCLIPDIKALLEFLHRREEFFVLNKEHFIVVPKLAVPEDTEEIAQMLEKELLKGADSKAPLLSVLENLKDEGFDHHFSSSTVLKAVLTRKDRFEICDDFLLLIEEQKESSGKTDSGDHAEMGSGDMGTGKKPQKTNCTPVNGMGWIISLDGESGLLAATFGSSDDYAEVVFKRDALSATSTNYNELIVGQEVEFIAVKDSDESEWVIVELKSAGSTPCGEEEKEDSEQGKRAHPSIGGKHHLDMCDAASDGNASTNGDDCIFYSSASDSEPVKLGAPPSTDHDTKKVKCPNFKDVTAEQVVQNGDALIQESTLEDSADVTIVDDGYDDCDWDTPYDRRIMDLPPFPTTEAFELCEKNNQVCQP